MNKAFKKAVYMVMSFVLLISTFMLPVNTPSAHASGDTSPFRDAWVTAPVMDNMGVNLPEGAMIYAFVDAVKSSRPLLPLNGGVNPVPTDALGWPMADARVRIMDIRPVGLAGGNADDTNFQAHLPDVSGTYHLSFKGQADFAPHVEGTSSGTWTYENKVYDAATNTTTADFIIPPYSKSDDLFVVIDFTNTKRTAESAAGTGITDIKLIKPGYDPNTTQLFTDEFIDALQPFSTIRFYEWNLGLSFLEYCKEPAVNNVCEQSTLEWENRKLPTFPTQAIYARHYDSVAWEYIATLANETGKDAWINIPAQATTDYIEQLAAFLKQELDPGIKIYLENSNEVWGGIPKARDFNFDAACVEVTGKICDANAPANTTTNLNDDGKTNHSYWNERLYARRIMEISNIFTEEFGEGSLNTRIRPVLAWQHVSPEGFGRMLSWLNTHYGDPSNYLYGLASGIYLNFLNCSFDRSNSALYDGCFRSLFDTEFGFDSVEQTKAIADSYNLEYVAYEGGTSTSGDGTNNVGARIAAERSPAMTNLIRDFLNRWASTGAGLFNYFNLYGTASRYGNWGLIESFGDLDTPKTQAIYKLATNPAQSPTNLVATATNDGVHLTWDASVSNDMDYDYMSYNIMRAASAVGPYELVKRGVTSTEYIDTDPTLEVDSTYYYKITAVNFAATADSAVSQVTLDSSNYSGRLIANESFDYDADSALLNKNGGNGWNGGWKVYAGSATNFMIADEDPPIYDSLVSEGNYLGSPNATSHVYRSFDLSADGAFKDYLNAAGTSVNKPGTVIWTSAVMRSDTDENMKFSFRPFFGTGTTNFLDIGYHGVLDNGKKYWDARFKYDVKATEKLVVAGETVLVVAKVEFGDANATKASVYFNPTSIDGIEPSGEPDLEGMFDTSVAGISRAVIEIDKDSASIDEIRYGTSFASVTPGLTAAAPEDQAPVFTTQPQGAAVALGGTVTLEAEAGGTSPIAYQWFKDAVALTGETNDTLTITDFSAADAGSYTVKATNTAGEAVSDPAVLTVADTDPGGDGDPLEAYIGENFDLTVGLKNVTPAFSAVEMVVQYDPSKLEFATKPLGMEDYPDTLALADEAISLVSDDWGLQILGTAVTPNGKIYITALATEGPIAAADKLDLYTLHGTVKSDASEGTTVVSLSDIQIADDGDSYSLDGNSYTLDLKQIAVDKAALSSLINTAQNAHNAATEGSGAGQYPSGAKTALQSAINQAQAVFDDSTVNQDQVDQAVASLQQAINTFNGSVIVENLDKANLIDAIGKAQAKHDSSEEGTKLTQYKAGAKATLQAAIQQATSVLGSASTQLALNNAVDTLKAALQTFNQQVVTLVEGETQITVKDLSLLAKYYMQSREEANWDGYDTADIYGEGITIQVLAKVARMMIEGWVSQQ